MVRTKSGEQAKRLAAKLKAAAEAKAPPAKPAKPKLANPVHLLGDRRPEENPAPAEESAEAVSRAKTITDSNAEGQPHFLIAAGALVGVSTPVGPPVARSNAQWSGFFYDATKELARLQAQDQATCACRREGPGRARQEGPGEWPLCGRGAPSQQPTAPMPRQLRAFPQPPPPGLEASCGSTGPVAKAQAAPPDSTRGSAWSLL